MEKEERFLTIKEVINRTSLGRSTIYFLIKEKQFPTSIKITNKKVVWLGAVNHQLGTKSMLTHCAGLPIYTPPNFPAKAAAVTTFKNLSIYTSTNSASYAMYTHNDSMNYITSFYRNEDYIVEDLGLMSAIAHENVVLGA